MGHELITQDETTQIGFVDHKPKEVVARATEAAKALQQIVNNRSKKLILGGKQYLYYEDWQTLAKFDNITAKVVSTEEIREDGKLIGFSARAVAVQHDVEISAAEAECCFDEPNWKNKPRFQLKSMAQTRACSKALRNVLAFIAVLADYEPTPAEEMDGVEVVQQNGKPKIKDTSPATAKQVTLIEKQIIGSHLLSDEEKERLAIKLDDMTKIEAMKIISWWIGNENGPGERSVREEKEKLAKQMENMEGEEVLL